MKNIIAIGLLLITLLGTAQNNGGCGTVAPQSFLTSYAAKDRSNYGANDSRASIRWIPVYYHIIAKNDGSGAASLRKVFESHCELNEDYNIFNIGFYIAGIDTIKSTTLWNYQNQNLGYQAFRDYNKSNVCNIYVNGNLPGLCGFATFPNTAPNGGGIFLNADCMGKGTTTIPHEMGHYLGLLHTFETAYGTEYVDGTNCSSAGDLFCDTPADFSDQRISCPYTGGATDPHGDLYRTVIDQTLFMSYFNDNCVNRFSTMEQNEMNSTLTSDRPNLLNQTLPDLNPLPAAVFIKPTDGDTTVLAPNVTFTWNKIPGAVFYIINVQNNAGTYNFLDSLTADTTITVSLSANKNFKYSVRGLSYGNTCTAGVIRTLATSSITATATVVTPSCPGQLDASITLATAGGAAPYTYTWSNGSTTNTLDNLSPGVYNVTITDNNGEVAVTQITVNDAVPVAASINAVGSNLNASATGGTAPYVYAWSNGINSQYNNNVQPGTYSVTVVDAKGCSSMQTINFGTTGIVDGTDVNVSMNVFPNPAQQTTQLNVQLNLNQSTPGAVYLVNMNGQVLQQIKSNFSSGSNNVTFDISTLSSGVYMVQFNNGQNLSSQRVSVIR